MKYNMRLGLTAGLVLSLIACGKNSEPGSGASPTPVEKPTTLSKEERIKKLPKIDPQNVEMVKVSAGSFVFGSNKTDDEGIQEQYGFPEPIYLDEHPEQRMSLPDFYIDKYEVSNIQFKEFILKTKRKLPYEWGQNGYGLTMEEASTMEIEKLRGIAADDFKLDMETRTMSREALMAEMQKEHQLLDPFPVTGIDWDYANEYCLWRGQRLPTELEWEKAARGGQGFEFPWGNNWDAMKTETGDDSEFEQGFAPVGSFPLNKSPYGAFDMGGNVWEWTATWYKPYPGSNYRHEFFGEQHRVIRGGGGGVGHYALSYFFRGATRQHADPRMAGEDVGFRCAKDA